MIFAVAICLLARQHAADVPNIPTPQAIVEQMLDLAHVTKTDLVYDLGCGDGRIVVTAARKYGARGVGIDIDPRAVQESRDSVRAAKVGDRVTILQGDLFAADISKATVVALYLSPELDVRLRPKLLRDLKPGSRVISHAYAMGDWQPDQTQPAGKDYHIFLWIIPSQVSGGWRWSIRTPAGAQSDFVHLAQRYQRLGGTFTVAGHDAEVTDGHISGDAVTFTAAEPAPGKARYHFDGRAVGKTVRGRLTVEGGPLAGSYPCTLERE